MSEARKVEGQASFEAQSTLEVQLPDRRHATLSRMDFAVLKDGDVSGIRASRDLCGGIACSGLIGFIGLIAAIDWDAAMRAGHLGSFIWAGTLGVIFASSFAVAVFYQIQIYRANTSSAYSILMKRLEEHFSANESTKQESASSPAK
jgi:hypothetical protein